MLILMLVNSSNVFDDFNVSYLRVTFDFCS